MSKEKELLKQKASIDIWHKEQQFADYARNHFSQQDEGKGKPKISKVLDNVYRLSLSAESEQVQLQAAKEIRETLSLGSKSTEGNTQINLFTQAAELSNKALDKLINVTPRNQPAIKAKINDLI